MQLPFILLCVDFTYLWLLQNLSYKFCIGGGPSGWVSNILRSLIWLHENELFSKDVYSCCASIRIKSIRQQFLSILVSQACINLVLFGSLSFGPKYLEGSFSLFHELARSSQAYCLMFGSLQKYLKYAWYVLDASNRWTTSKSWTKP